MRRSAEASNVPLHVQDITVLTIIAGMITPPTVRKPKKGRKTFPTSPAVPQVSA